MNGQQAVILRDKAVGVGQATGHSVQSAYQAAFVEMYERYYTKVFAYVYTRVNNVEVAKDLTAEVFEKAYVKGHSVREAAAYVTWLFIIAKNLVVGHYRRHKRETNGVNKMKESLWLAGASSNPEDDAIRGEAASDLMEHVRRLSRRDQELLALKFEGELSYTEIGHVLQMSEVNVRVSTFRALKRLREMMKKTLAARHSDHIGQETMEAPLSRPNLQRRRPTAVRLATLKRSGARTALSS